DRDLVPLPRVGGRVREAAAAGSRDADPRGAEPVAARVLVLVFLRGRGGAAESHGRVPLALLVVEQAIRAADHRVRLHDLLRNRRLGLRHGHEPPEAAAGGRRAGGGGCGAGAGAWAGGLAVGATSTPPFPSTVPSPLNPPPLLPF